MKVTRRDLDEAILTKLDSLDNVAKTYDERFPDGFVSYGPNGFYFKKTNDTFLKKVFDENEITALEEGLYVPRKNVKSTVFHDLRTDNKVNNATKSFVRNMKSTNYKEFDDKVLIYKRHDLLDYVFTLDGNLTVIHEKSSDVINISKILDDNFSIASKRCYPTDIVDIEVLNRDEVIIATSNFGIYKLNVPKKEMELLFAVEDVVKVKLLHNGNLFVAAKLFCAQYELVTGYKVENYLNLYNQSQRPVDLMLTNTEIFVLATNMNSINNENIIHCWKLDDSKTAYNCVSKQIEKIALDNRYQVLFESFDINFVYIAGLFGDHPFVLAIDRRNYRVHKKIIFKNCCIDSFDDFRAIDGRFFILADKDLYIANMEGIDEHMILDGSYSRIKVLNGEIISSSNNRLVKFQLDKFDTVSDSLEYIVLDDAEPCNNIDILVKGVGRSERITLIDAETKKEIPASYYILYKGNAIIKLMNCKSKKIVLRMAVTPTSNVEGIVIKKNRIFLR